MKVRDLQKFLSGCDPELKIVIAYLSPSTDIRPADATCIENYNGRDIGFKEDGFEGELCVVIFGEDK